MPAPFIRVRALQSNQDVFELRRIGFAIQGEAKKAGLSCVAWWKNPALTIAIQGMSLSLVTQMVGRFAKQVVDEGKALEVIQHDTVPVREGDLPMSNLQRDALIRQKLTKKLLLSLPAGPL